MIQKLLNRKALTNDQFQRANKAVIEQESNHQKKVTDTVVEIVDKMDGDFQDVLGEMAYINESIDAAHVAMNGIAKTSFRYMHSRGT